MGVLDMQRRKFGEILVEAGVLTQANLDKALDLQMRQGGRLGEVLEAMELISEKDITLVLAHQYGMQAVSKLAERMIPDAVLNTVNGETALEKMIFPLRRTEKSLYLAMVNPLDKADIERFGEGLGLHIVPFLTTPEEIHSAVRKHYHGESASTLNKQWRVLVVSSGNEVSTDIRQALHAEGFQVFDEGGLLDGLRAVLRHEPHLALVDISMTRTNEFDMFQILQSNDVTRNIPVMALTGNPSIEEEVRLLNEGYWDYLGVPLPHERLVARVKRALHFSYGRVGDRPFAVV